MMIYMWPRSALMWHSETIEGGKSMYHEIMMTSWHGNTLFVLLALCEGICGFPSSRKPTVVMIPTLSSLEIIVVTNYDATGETELSSCFRPWNGDISTSLPSAHIYIYIYCIYVCVCVCVYVCVGERGQRQRLSVGSNKPVLTYCQLDPREQTSVKFNSK